MILNTYYVTFKKDCGNFADFSEGANIAEAVERLGMKMSDIESWKIMPKMLATPEPQMTNKEHADYTKNRTAQIRGDGL